MATHIIMLCSPLDNEGLESLFSLLSACPDEELFTALEEVEEDQVDPELDKKWCRAGEAFKASMLQDALLERAMALEEVELAEMQFQAITRDIEKIQVLDDMAKHARRIFENASRKLERIERFIEYGSSHESCENAPELLARATRLKEKLEQRLTLWSDEYASGLEEKAESAKKKFNNRGISLEGAQEALRQASEALEDAEALIASLQ